MDTLLDEVPQPARRFTAEVTLTLPGCQDAQFIAAFAASAQYVADRFGMTGTVIADMTPELRIRVELEAPSGEAAASAAAREIGDAAGGWLDVSAVSVRAVRSGG